MTCLHCAIRDAIEDWMAEEGADAERDVDYVVHSLAWVCAEAILGGRDPAALRDQLVDGIREQVAAGMETTH